MYFTESFSEFSSRIGPMDLALYAGVGIVVWVLFKDKLSPVQKIVLDFVNKLKSPKTDKVTSIDTDKIFQEINDNVDTDKQSLFFDLVVSWKQTRDLAEKSGCSKAVEVADKMFPYLSPMVCEGEVIQDEE